MKLKLFLTLIPVVFLICTNCNRNDQDYRFPLAEQNNINAERLEDAFQSAYEINGLGALVIERNNIIVAEEYFHDFDQNDLFNVKSVTKSITSILIGIALEEGIIDSLDQKLTDYIGHLIDTQDEQKRSVTFRHALTMTGGFEWYEWEDETIYNNWVTDDDQINFLYDQDMESEPGTKFVYNSALTHLLSVALEEATGMSELEFAKQYLFTPMEINKVDWYDFPQGYNNGGADLMVRPIDMIKLGRFCLDGGSYNGNQLVSSDWIKESTKMQVSTNNLFLHGEEYGYLWWKGSEGEKEFFWALGYGGQFIVCIPNFNTVIVATSDFHRSLIIPTVLWTKVEDLIMNEILPCIE